MGSAEKKTKVSVTEYFTYLDGIEGRAEYFDGVIYDMAGGEPEHSRIASNCGSAIDAGLGDRDCSVFSNDLHIGFEQSKAYFFPDLTLICGELQYSSIDGRVVTNPQLIVEVLSPSTMDRDRTYKLLRYMQIPTLREYILIEQSKPQVEMCFINEEGVWDYEKIIGLDGQILLRSLGIKIPMAKIYRRVKFAENPESEEEVH